MKDLAEALHARRQAGLYRVRRIVEGPQRPVMDVDGRRVISFCSNDYLGLANHPAVIQAFKQGADDYGVGSGAAHLVNGHTRAHHALEEELAIFANRDRAILFSTGYMANLGVAVALAGRTDTVFEDRLNHASLLDAGLLARAKLIRYAHADPQDLDHRLQIRTSGRRLILTDGVFSMDGDLAPLPDLAAAAQRHDAWLMVDDAHGLGVLGAAGRGTLNRFGLSQDDVPILMGTLGKAFGTFGAFVAGSETLIETLVQVARTYIYTTAIPPAAAEATRAALRIVQQEDGRRDHLNALIHRFRQGAEAAGLRLMASQSPIQPLRVGDASQALDLSERLLANGLLVTAIRPPTVPTGTARLRITLSAAHREEHVDRLLDILQSEFANQEL